MASELLTVDDLIDSLAKCEKYRNAHEDLRSYYGARAQYICRLFSCDIDARVAELDAIANERGIEFDTMEKAEFSYEFHGGHTRDFLMDCIGYLNHSVEPGMIWLEGMPPKIVRDVKARYRGSLHNYGKALQAVYHDMIRDLLEFMFPGICTQTHPAEKLYEMGLQREEPDVDDYW